VIDRPSAGAQKPKIDTTVPHSARMWNFWLGGKDNYPVDRMAGEQVMQMVPEMPRIARLQRAFLARAIPYLAGEQGIRQFSDLPGMCGVGRKP
jgi:hypothetical protein